MSPRKHTYRSRRTKGLSILEAIAAAAIVTIVILGTSKFSYFATTDSKWAANQIAAARIGLVLVESWRGVSGSVYFEPVASLSPSLNIEQSVGPQEPANFTLLGSYKIEVDDSIYYATLSWRDVSPGLRALHVNIIRPKPEPGENIEARFSQDDFERRERLFQMTSYTLY